MVIAEKYKLPFYCILLGGFLIMMNGVPNKIGNLPIVLGILFIVLGGAGIIFMKKRETNAEFSRNIQEYFPKYAIISIISAVVGIVLFFLLTPGFYTTFYLATNFYFGLDKLALPFMFIALISGVKCFKQNNLPIIEVIGAVIGLIFIFLLIVPFIIGIFSLLLVPFLV